MLPHTPTLSSHSGYAGKSSSEAASGDTFLQACRFFDRECIGYLDADDLEEIAFMVSDGISRKPKSHDYQHDNYAFVFIRNIPYFHNRHDIVETAVPYCTCAALYLLECHTWSNKGWLYM